MEPSLSWGLRMALASVVPVIWGLSAGRAAAGEWVALGAECICWVALKGTYAQRLRILAGGIILTTTFAWLGSITGGSLLLSIGCTLVVAFLAGLFRNLGERGSGLSLCVYIMFLVANAYPVSGVALQERLLATLAGGCWNAALALVSIFFLPAQQPYRRNISVIWRAAAVLMEQIAKGWDGIQARSSQRDIYLADKGVRTAIDTSFVFHERAAHQVRSKGGGAEYQLAQGRKSAALVAVHMMAIAEELEPVRLKNVDEALRILLFNLIHSIQRATERMSALVLTRRAEEEVLMADALDEIRRQLNALEEYKVPAPIQLSRIVRRVMQLSGRCLRMMERSTELLAALSETRVFRAYPMLKTIYVLHPRHLLRSLRLLFSIDSQTARYALRMSLAATLAVAIYKWRHIGHGYWLPFTVIIVMQPYFTATFRKAIDRLIGTISGGIAGGLLLLLPAGSHMKEAMLFASAIAMVHFFRVQYRISAFFITLNLVLLLSVSQELDKHIILLRAGATLAGALIAVAAGFLLLPHWDRKWLPRFLGEATENNRIYFMHTFSGKDIRSSSWTKCKRHAEVSNGNAFDSFNRATHEPGGLKSDYSGYYQFITHNVRITRELNNINLEEEGRTGENKDINDEATMNTIRECAALFQDVAARLITLTGRPAKNSGDIEFPELLPTLNPAQKIYLSRLHTELRLLQQNIIAITGASGTTFSEAPQPVPSSR